MLCIYCYCPNLEPHVAPRTWLPLAVAANPGQVPAGVERAPGNRFFFFFLEKDF